MQHKLSSLSLLALIITSNAFAKTTKLSVLGGLGNSQVTTGSVSAGESPMSMGISLDYLIDERRNVGVEHIRSLNMSPISTGVSLTGLTGKWYFYNPQPQVLPPQRTTGVSLSQSIVSPYVGLGFGFAQSSVYASSGVAANAVGAYIGLKLGADYPIYEQFGVHSELGYSTSVVGAGGIQIFYAQIGGYIYF